MPLACLLRYAYGLRDLLIQDMTQAAMARYGFHDVLIAMLASEVRDLLHRGLSLQYIPIQERLASPRGRLVVSEIARRGGLASAALDCKYYQRSTDWLLNRVLKAGLMAAAGMTRARELQREMHELASQFEFVQEKSTLLDHDLRLAEWSLTRLTDFNAPALAIVRILQDMMGIDFEGPRNSVPIRGFLFDMNRFFQRLLSRFLREHLSDASIVDEKSIRYLFAYSVDANPRRRAAPRPRPDYALLRGNTLVGFLDAKYRDLWHFDVPPAWIYQLSTYAFAAPRRASIMLYPTLDARARDERLEVRQPIGPSAGNIVATVTMRPVPLIELAELLACDPPDRAACKQLAARLVDLGI
jgi:5-methylcytosine-specific restriction enzyme subunit McrC